MNTVQKNSRGVNLHIHPVSLDHASRILKGLASAGRSGCFQARAFIGAGLDKEYQLVDALGSVHVRLVPRSSGSGSGPLRKTLATLAWSGRVKKYARAFQVRCINVHGLSTLLLGVALKRHFKCKLIYDTHELESKALAIRGVRRFYSGGLERVLIRRCDAVICVSDGIADWYANQYRMKRPLVVRNVPDRRSQQINKSSQALRKRCAAPQNALLFLYQGNLVPGRQVEQFIEVFAGLPNDRHLVFLGRGELEPIVRNAAVVHPNIHLCPAVPPSEVLSFTAQGDVGLVGMENTCLNHYLSLPNKFFEYLAAGVPVIIPNFPEMRRVIDDHQCGWVWSGGVENLSKMVQSLSRDAVEGKKTRASIAGQELTWEREEQGLLNLYHQVLN